jgi:hypothetical protein
MPAAFRSRLTFANVVSLIALFVALGGGAYALTIPRNSVGARQLKKNAVISSKVRNNSLLAEDFKPGQLPRGEDASKLFAYIRDGGSADTATVQYGSGVSAVSDPPGDDSYTVTFSRSLVNCVVQAVAGFGDPAGSPGGAGNLAPLVDLSPGTAEQVEVTFRTGTGTLSDTSFMVTAFC